MSQLKLLCTVQQMQSLSFLKWKLHFCVSRAALMAKGVRQTHSRFLLHKGRILVTKLRRNKDLLRDPQEKQIAMTLNFFFLSFKMIFFRHVANQCRYAFKSYLKSNEFVHNFRAIKLDLRRVQISIKKFCFFFLSQCFSPFLSIFWSFHHLFFINFNIKTDLCFSIFLSRILKFLNLVSPFDFYEL